MRVATRQPNGFSASSRCEASVAIVASMMRSCGALCSTNFNVSAQKSCAHQAEQRTSNSGSYDAEDDVHEKPISLFMNCSASQPAIPPTMIAAVQPISTESLTGEPCTAAIVRGEHAPYSSSPSSDCVRRCSAAFRISRNAKIVRAAIRRFCSGVRV